MAKNQKTALGASPRKKHSEDTKALETLPWRIGMARMFPDAAERILATGEWPKPDEATRKKWTSPHQKLQIDNVVQTLIQRRNADASGNRLRSDAEIREQALFSCPYHYARMAAVIAMFDAQEAAEREKHYLIKYKESEQLEAKLNDLVKQLDRALEPPRLDSIINWHSRGDAQVNVEARMLAAGNVRDNLELVCAGKTGLLNLCQIMAQERGQWSKPNKTSDIWGQTFAQVMARCWYNLTGNKPSRNSGTLFQTFLESAAADLLEDSETPLDDRFLSVTDSIQKQASKPDGEPDERPWDNLDRDIKGLTAPGSVQARSYLETEESREQGRNAWRRHRRRIIRNEMNMQSISGAESSLTIIGGTLLRTNESFYNYNIFLSLFGLMAQQLDQFNALEENVHKDGLPLSLEIKEDLRRHDFIRNSGDPVMLNLSTFYIALYYSSKNIDIRRYIAEITGGDSIAAGLVT